MLLTIQMPAMEGGLPERPDTAGAGSSGRDTVFPVLFAGLMHGAAPASPATGEAALPAAAGAGLPAGGKSLPLPVDPDGEPVPGGELLPDGEPAVTEAGGQAPVPRLTGERDQPAAGPADAALPDLLLTQRVSATPPRAASTGASLADDEATGPVAAELPAGPMRDAASVVSLGVATTPAVDTPPHTSSTGDAGIRRPPVPEVSLEPAPPPAVRQAEADFRPPVPVPADPVLRTVAEATGRSAMAAGDEGKSAQAGALATVSATSAPPAVSGPQPAVAPSPVAVPVPAVLPDIRPPPGAPGWSEALGDRVLWLTGAQAQNAEIRLHPAEMGPLRVQVSMDDGTATINFQAQHPLTRDAIEQALPRLREMLGEQGITLGDTNVSDQEARHEAPAEPGVDGLGEADTTDDLARTGDDAPALRTPQFVSHSMVDLYA